MNNNKSLSVNEFNKKFESTNIPNINVDPIEYNNKFESEFIPHKQPIENIIIDIRDVFFQILNLIEDKQNPIPYIYSSNKRQFSFSLFLIIFGSLLLLLSSLMKSPEN